MTWRDAFTNLAAMSVMGVTTSYDVDALPNTLPAADLPALAPAFPDALGVLSEGEQGLSTLTYDGGVWTASLLRGSRAVLESGVVGGRVERGAARPDRCDGSLSCRP